MRRRLTILTAATAMLAFSATSALAAPNEIRSAAGACDFVVGLLGIEYDCPE